MCSTSLKVTINSFIYNIVRDRRANASEYGDDLLTLFLQDATKRGEELSDEYLRNIILNFMVSEPRKTLRARGPLTLLQAPQFCASSLRVRVVLLPCKVAGRDTTATALTWLFYAFSKFPATEAPCVTEVRSSLSASVQPRAEAIKSLTQLEAAFMETTRLWPPVPADIKECVKDSVFPCGTKIPKGYVLLLACVAVTLVSACRCAAADVLFPPCCRPAPTRLQHDRVLHDALAVSPAAVLRKHHRPEALGRRLRPVQARAMDRAKRGEGWGEDPATEQLRSVAMGRMVAAVCAQSSLLTWGPACLPAVQISLPSMPASACVWASRWQSWRARWWPAPYCSSFAYSCRKDSCRRSASASCGE